MITTQMLRRHVGKSTNPYRLNGIVVTAASLIMLAAMLGPIFLSGALLAIWLIGGMVLAACVV